MIYKKSYPDDEDCKKEMAFIDNQSTEYIEPTKAPEEEKASKDKKKNTKTKR
ncbi:MAG: hypothetical protein MJ151_02575 [Lachnospiraceae bacterium]|nr:hypothetical protein [Lachnospiraceae bacterium]